MPNTNQVEVYHGHRWMFLIFYLLFLTLQSPVLESDQTLRCTTPDDSARATDSVSTANGSSEIDATAATRSELCSDASDLDDEGIGESESDVVRTRSCSDRAATDVGSGPLHVHSTTSDIHSYISESIHRQNLTDVCDLVGAEPGQSVGTDDVAASAELDGSVHNGGTSSSGGSSSTLVDCGKDTPGGATSDDDVAKLPAVENWEMEDSGKDSAENSDEEYRRYFRATLTKTTDSAERGKADFYSFTFIDVFLFILFHRWKDCIGSI